MVDAELERIESSDDAAWGALGRIYELLGDSAREALVLERRIVRAVHSSRPPADPALLFRLARARVTDPATVEQQSRLPGKIFEHLIILGSATNREYASAPVDIRAFDVRTGAHVWSFRTMPRRATWPNSASCS
jgi:hypothetical protein